MIRLQIDDATLYRTRLTISPLWETIGSLAILARYRGDVPNPYTNWARSVRPGMPAELSRDLVDAMRHRDSLLLDPGFVPVPSPSRSSITDELEHLRATQPRNDRTDRIIGLLERYWDWAIAPHWGSIRSSLEEETLFRGRTLVVQGPEAMLHELDGRVMWSHPTLTAPYHHDLDLTVTQSQLLLVPTVFAGGLRLFGRQEDAMAMAYQARATGYFHVLSESVLNQESDDRLALLLGKGRAQVVRALESPQTTTSLAGTLGLAKSTVSQHLTVLIDSGIAWKQRVGGRVFYELDNDGRALLGRLGQPSRVARSSIPG
ncbi:DNA-binding transcriptional ArsR family regulator [Streptomyces sp. Ag109_G2-6]|uniref:ArsR/SmtB family transcription factor n=1 Tax=Streptomyces TaxID=1883 RepID=UPI0009A4AB23|nr:MULTISPECIES: winged helix-turn-helix domain-containing protein [Streptomyces]RPF41845.1 DNA-binding transcriptional ArsR family regulator [Streptomyces sp. Ag109_G2-6]